MNTWYEINSDLTAELTDNDYLLTIRSESLNDYDTYKLDEDQEWEQNYDSLTNKLEAASQIWENPEFAEWAKELAKKAKA